MIHVGSFAGASGRIPAGSVVVAGPLAPERAVDIVEEDAEIRHVVIFGMNANRFHEMVQPSGRCIVKLPHFVEPLDEGSANHQGKERDMVRLVLGLHRFNPCSSHLDSFSRLRGSE